MPCTTVSRPDQVCSRDRVDQHACHPGWDRLRSPIGTLACSGPIARQPVVDRLGARPCSRDIPGWQASFLRVASDHPREGTRWDPAWQAIILGKARDGIRDGKRSNPDCLAFHPGMDREQGRGSRLVDAVGRRSDRVMLAVPFRDPGRGTWAFQISRIFAPLKERGTGRREGGKIWGVTLDPRPGSSDRSRRVMWTVLEAGLPWATLGTGRLLKRKDVRGSRELIEYEDFMGR